MNQLPKKLEAPEGCGWNEESPHFKINEIISYLESQKEGLNCQKHSMAGFGKCPYCKLEAKEEPEQIDVEAIVGEYSVLDRHVTMCITLGCGTCRLYVRKMEEIINTIKQALQQ